MNGAPERLDAVHGAQFVAPREETVEIDAVPSRNVVDGGEFNVLVTLKPPEGTGRQPTDIVCVIDVSLSMNKETTLQNEKGGAAERTGLSILDVVKHAMKT